MDKITTIFTVYLWIFTVGFNTVCKYISLNMFTECFCGLYQDLWPKADLYKD